MSGCRCGCGQPTTIAPKTRKKYGWKKGEPIPYVKGHNGRAPAELRFWAKVEGLDAEGCWLWTAGTNYGYGQFNDGVTLRPVKAHRFAWELLRGSIPEGLVIDHLCFVRACVNPWHMELVTPSENARRVRANQHTGKTHCVNGHEFTPENTYSKSLNKKRQCRACSLRSAKESRGRRRLQALLP